MNQTNYCQMLFTARWRVARNTCQSFIIKFRLNSTMFKFRFRSSTAYSDIGRAAVPRTVRGGWLELENNSGTLSRTDVNLTIFDAHRWIRDVTVLISLIFRNGLEGHLSQISFYHTSARFKQKSRTDDTNSGQLLLLD